MRWSVPLLTCLIALGGCDGGCGTGTTLPGTASSPDGSAAEPPIRIGAVLSLTGPQGSFGVSSRNGIQLAVNEANAAGGVHGRTLEIRVVDARGQPEEAARAAQWLIDEEHVRLLLGEVASANSLTMAAVAQANQVPMVSPSSTNPKVTEGKDYVTRVCFIDAFQGLVMARFARENLKLRSVAVLREKGSDYSTGLADVFTRQFTEMGGRVVAQETYEKGEQNFKAALERIQDAGPEAIYVPGYYAEVALIAKTARAIGLDVPLLGGDGWASDRLNAQGAEAVEGHYFSNHYSPEDPSPRSQKFIAAYKAQFGEVPDSLAALGYDAARVAIEALKRSATLDGPSVRAALVQTRDFPGVTGNISLDSRRNAVKPAVVLQLVHGRAKYVTTVPP